MTTATEAKHTNHSGNVRKHYASPNLLARIEAGLEKIGKTRDTVTIDDLAPVDEFHSRATAATKDLIELLDPAADAHVLDAGSGLGGPARRLAKTTGCRVTGIDLSETYCDAGAALNRWLGLDGQVRLRPGDATDLRRLDARSFDAAWTIHTAMNIADKDALYGAIARVLKPGARFVIYDVLTTSGEDIHFPVPWARDPSTSFLSNLDQVTGHLAAAGFDVLETRDQSAEALAFFEQGLARLKRADGPPPLGLHLVLGPDVPAMIANLHRNLSEQRIAVAAVSCHKTA